MPVFQKENTSILFVHIPKTAGTAIEHFFRRQKWKISFFDGGENRPSINTVSWCSPQHLHAETLKNIFNVKRFSYCFTIVRDPIDRIKSEVRWRKKFFNEKIEPERWIDESLKTYPLNPFIHDNHIRPQSDFIFEGLDVYYMENGLAPVIANLTSRFPDHLISAPAIPPVMTSQDSGYEIELSADLLTRLKEFYAIDYRNFHFPSKER